MPVVLSVFCWFAREIFGNWTVKHCYYKAKTMNITETDRLSFRTWYPGCQRFFLECDERGASSAGRHAEETSGEATRKTFGNRSWKASGTQGTAVGDWWRLMSESMKRRTCLNLVGWFQLPWWSCKYSKKIEPLRHHFIKASVALHDICKYIIQLLLPQFFHVKLSFSCKR